VGDGHHIGQPLTDNVEGDDRATTRHSEQAIDLELSKLHLQCRIRNIIDQQQPNDDCGAQNYSVRGHSPNRMDFGDPLGKGEASVTSKLKKVREKLQFALKNIQPTFAYC